MHPGLLFLAYMGDPYATAPGMSDVNEPGFLTVSPIAKMCSFSLWLSHASLTDLITSEWGGNIKFRPASFSLSLLLSLSPHPSLSFSLSLCLSLSVSFSRSLSLESLFLLQAPTTGLTKGLRCRLKWSMTIIRLGVIYLQTTMPRVFHSVSAIDWCMPLLLCSPHSANYWKSGPVNALLTRTHFQMCKQTSG